MRNKSILGFTLALLSRAQNPGPTSPAAKPEEPARLQGTVVNALTGEPIARAHIALNPMNAQVGGPKSNANGQKPQSGAMTDGEGKFSMVNLEPGAYAASADRTSFVMPFANNQQRVNLKLAAGESKADFKLNLLPTGEITGRVVDAEGQPIEAATVVAKTNIQAEAAGTIGVTDEKGQFRIGGLGPGKYRVKATPPHTPLPPEIRTDGTTEVNYAAAYYPSTADLKSAPRVDVRPGAGVTGLEIRLPRVPFVRVSGAVSGIPKGSTTNLQILQGGSYRSVQVKPDGTFELWDLDPGAVRLVAIRFQPSQIRTSPVDLELGSSSIENVVLRFVAPSDLSGQVVFPEDPPPQPNTKPAGRRRITLRAIGDNPYTFQGVLEPDDTFLVKEVPPDRYRVLFLAEPEYVASMLLGGTNVDGNLLDLRDGNNGASLNIMALPASGEISGTVRDEKGPAKGLIVISSEDPDSAMYPKYGFAKPDGTFRIEGIAPGRYRVAAVDPDDPAIDTANGRADLESYADVALSVEIHSKEKIARDLKRHNPAQPR